LPGYFFRGACLRAAALSRSIFDAQRPAFRQSVPAHPALWVARRPGHLLAFVGVPEKFFLGAHLVVLRNVSSHNAQLLFH
jgi:hypothetical protein